MVPAFTLTVWLPHSVIYQSFVFTEGSDLSVCTIKLYSVEHYKLYFQAKLCRNKSPPPKKTILYMYCFPHLNKCCICDLNYLSLGCIRACPLRCCNVFTCTFLILLKLIFLSSSPQLKGMNPTINLFLLKWKGNLQD